MHAFEPFTFLWQALAAILSGQKGPLIDQNGGDKGPLVDPSGSDSNGLEGEVEDKGPLIDPDG